MIIDLIGGSYEHRFKSWNAQRTINWYPKITDQKSMEKNKTQIGLFPRPGLTEIANLGGTSIRGMFNALTLTQERCFVITSNDSNTSLWEINYDFSSTLIGDLIGMATGSCSKVYMACNGNSQLFIQDTMAAYIFDLTNNVLTKVVTEDYPKGTSLDYADGYFIISGQDGRVHFSALNDGNSWPGFNFFTPTYKPDKVKAIVSNREEIYCFGDETIEIYINDGTTPFIRQLRSSIYCGLTAKDSIALHQSGVFLYGKSRTGGSDVYLMGSDYSLTPLKIPNIATEIDHIDAEGFVQTSKDGHIFYHLHLPALATTFVYDLTTKMWHERQSQRPFPDADGSKIQDMYRGRNFVTFKGVNLFGDWWSGKIFKEDIIVATDDGNPRTLKRVSSVLNNELKYISVYSLEFDVNAGVRDNSTMMTQYSMNGGNTFSSEELLMLGNIGEYDQKVSINNLGTARNWVIAFEISDPVDVIIMQAVAKGSMSTW